MRFSTLLWTAVALGILSILLVVRFVLGVTETFLSVQDQPLPKGEAVTTLHSGMSDRTLSRLKDGDTSVTTLHSGMSDRTLSRLKDGDTSVTTLHSGRSDLQTEIGKVDVDALPDPATLLKGMRGLLDKYDRPEYVEHARRVMHMDPGELARMHLGAQE
jgi:hypothetical protein